MLTRTITIAGNPNIEKTLYFNSKSGSSCAPVLVGDFYTYKDDFGQELAIYKDAVILVDIITNGAEMLRVQGEGKIMEIKAQVAFQKRVESDPELKVMREAMARKQNEEARTA